MDVHIVNIFEVVDEDVDLICKKKDIWLSRVDAYMSDVVLCLTMEVDILICEVVVEDLFVSLVRDGKTHTNSTRDAESFYVARKSDDVAREVLRETDRRKKWM